MTITLSDKKQPSKERVYEFICRYKDLNDGNSPTFRQIMAACAITSTAVVSYAMNKLEAEGRIKRVKGQSCQITILR